MKNLLSKLASMLGALIIFAGVAFGVVVAPGGSDTRAARDARFEMASVAHAQDDGPSAELIDKVKNLGAFPLDVSKTLTAPCATSGGIVTCSYKISVENNYTEDNWGTYSGPVKLLDSFYPQVATTVVSVTGGWSCTNGTTVTCEHPSVSIAPQAEVEFTLTLSSSTSASPAADFNCIRFDIPKSEGGSCADGPKNGPVYGLDAEKQIYGFDSPEEAVVGKSVYFEIGVVNKAGVPANSQIVVKDQIPAGFTVTSLTYDTNYWTCSPATGTGPYELTCTHSTATAAIAPPTNLSAHEYLPKIEVHGRATTTGAYNNCAVAYVPGGENAFGDYPWHCALLWAFPDDGLGREDVCLKLEPKVELLPSGKVRVTLSHTAPAGFGSPAIEIRTDAPGVSVAPLGQPNGTTTKWLLSGATPGQTIKLFAEGVIPGGGSVGRGEVDKCCNGEVEIKIPDEPTKGDKKHDLKIDKTGWQQAGPHHWYEINVTNVESEITQSGAVTVTDTLPTGMAVMSMTATGWTCTTSGQTFTCIYTGPTPIATGATLPPIKLFVLYPALTVPENCAAVALAPSSGLVDINPLNNKDCVTIRIPPPPKQDPYVDLLISKQARTVVGPIPYTSEFTLGVRNSGTVAITAPATITVTDVVPAGMTFMSAGGTNWNCGIGYPKSSGATVTCTYTGPMPVAAGANLPPIKIVGAAPESQGRSIRNCASVALASSTQSDAYPASNKTCVETVIRYPDCPFGGPAKPKKGDPNAGNKDCLETEEREEERTVDLQMTKTASATIGPIPNTSEFKLSVRNIGTAAVTAPATIGVTDVVPAGMTFLSATGTTWNCGTGYPKSAGATITCTFTGALTVAPGANLPAIKIVAAAQGSQGQRIRNCAKVRLTSRTQDDANAGNNEDCASVETNRQAEPATRNETSCSPPQHWNGRRCVACAANQDWNERLQRCERKEPERRVCDRRTTNVTATGCSCRYPNMQQIAPNACACPANTRLRPGAGCAPIPRGPRPSTPDQAPARPRGAP